MQGNDHVLGQFLIDAGLLTRSQLSDLSQSTAPLSRTLVDLGIMGEDEVRRATAHALGVPFVVIDPYDIDIAALTLIPEPLSRSRNLVAFRDAGGTMSVALLDLADLEALEPLLASGHFGSRRVVAHLTTRDTVMRALHKYQIHLKEKFGELFSSGMHMAEALIGHALYSRAGGAHVDLSTHGALVRYQVGHALHEAFSLSEQAGRQLVAQLKSLARVLPVARPQEGKFKIEKDGESVHIHLSTTPTINGERLQVRFARQAHGQLGHTLEALGLHGQNLDALRHALSRRRGLLVVSGAKGSGTTTLLYTMLDLLQHPGISLTSVETKVGYRLPNVAQVEVSGGVSMIGALRASLRQHPDVLMIGSVDTAEVASLAQAAAARGIFVLAGVAAGEGAAESLFSAPVALVRTALVRRLATNQFASQLPLSRAESEALEHRADFRKVYEALKDEQVVAQDMAWKDITFAHPNPSTEHPDGYAGHIGVQEVVAPGFETLSIVEDALFKAAQGITSVEEALRIAKV